jgi:hypothetical protein
MQHEWERREIHIVMVGKHEGWRPLARHRRRREVNIKMYLKNILREGIDWINLAQDRDQ